MSIDNLATLALCVSSIVNLCLVTCTILQIISHKGDKYPELHHLMSLVFHRVVLPDAGMEYYTTYTIPDILSKFPHNTTGVMTAKSHSDVVAECKELVSSYESGDFWLIEPRYCCEDLTDVWDAGSLLDVALWYRDVMYTNIPDGLYDTGECPEFILGSASIIPIATDIVNELPVTNIVLIYKVRKMLMGLIDGL
jgi:hypothetical protein